MSFNYRIAKQRRKPVIVGSHDELPSGNWVPVSQAAKVKNYNPMTVRVRFLKGKCRGYKVTEKGVLLVNLEEIM